MRPSSQIKWPYYRTRSGYDLPYINARIQTERGVSGPNLFIVDTGALFSFAPYSYSQDVADLTQVVKVKTPCVTVNGTTLEGYPVDVKLTLLPSGRVVKECVYFAEKNELAIAVLGHQSFLKQFPALFWTGNGNGSLTLFNVP